MEDLKKLEVKNWKETAKDRRTWLRRRKPTNGYSAKRRWWWWWWWRRLSCNDTVSTTKDAKCYWDVPTAKNCKSGTIAVYKEQCFGKCLQGLRKIIRLPIVIVDMDHQRTRNLYVQPAVSCPFVSAESIKTDI